MEIASVILLFFFLVFAIPLAMYTFKNLSSNYTNKYWVVSVTPLVIFGNISGNLFLNFFGNFPSSIPLAIVLNNVSAIPLPNPFKRNSQHSFKFFKYFFCVFFSYALENSCRSFFGDSFETCFENVFRNFMRNSKASVLRLFTGVSLNFFAILSKPVLQFLWTL